MPDLAITEGQKGNKLWLNMEPAFSAEDPGSIPVTSESFLPSHGYVAIERKMEPEARSLGFSRIEWKMSIPWHVNYR